MKIRKRHRSLEIVTDLRMKAALLRQLTVKAASSNPVQRATFALMAMVPVYDRHRLDNNG